MTKRFKDIFLNRYSLAKEWKSQGRKIIGWACTYVPEEIISAAGYIPFRVVGGSPETPMADAYLYTNLCRFARSALEEGFNHNYDFLDGLVTCNTCDAIRRMYDIWSIYLNTPFTHILSLPHKFGKASVSYFRDRLSRFKKALERTFAVEIDNDSLRKAISVYNRTRTLLKELYNRRKSDSPPLTGAEALDVVLAGMVLPKEEYNRLLEDFLTELPQSGGRSPRKARLMITGSELDSREYLELIEDLGGLVVIDDICTGSRYFWDLVDAEEDPLTALAYRYINRAPCARMRPSTFRIEQLKRLIKDYRIDGVIFEGIKFCDLYGGDYLLIKTGLEDLEVPILRLEREYGKGGVAQVKTRVQAFLEQIEESIA